jgi:hypothetical protein
MYITLLLQYNTALKYPKIAAEVNGIIKIFSSMMEIIREYILDITIRQKDRAASLGIKY